MSSNNPIELARLFLPRPPLKYLPPTEKDLPEPPSVKVTGIAEYVNLFSEVKDDDPATEAPKKTPSKKVHNM